jgi:hypothetical protein
MATIKDGNLIGFYANLGFDRQDDELVKAYLWGDNGLDNKLSSLKSKDYGHDFELILFQFYVRPSQELQDVLREIGNYRRKEKSIGIPIIVGNGNFFRLSTADQQSFLKKTILDKLELLTAKIKRNKLDLDVSGLKSSVERLL